MAGNFRAALDQGATRRMAMMGRGGDRMMGHLTPGEGVIPRSSWTPKLWSAFQEALDRQGMMPEQYVVGSGFNSVNPMTGQPEFLAQTAAPGRAVRDFQRDRVQGPEGGSEERTGPQGPIVNPPPPGLGRGAPPIDPTVEYQRAEPSFGEEVEEMMTPFAPSYSPEDGLRLGFLEAIPLIGPAVRAGNRWGGGLSPEARARLDRLEASRRDPDRMQGMSAQRAARELSFVRPAAEPAPQFLGLSSAMTPLQMRTAVATRALASQGGEYTSPEAATFYDNLLQRALIGDTGELFGLETLLPIDLQYLAQIRGIQNPADTQALLAAIQ